jgi:hypothetical protein
MHAGLEILCRCAPIYYQTGKARLANWHAQVQRDALARAARASRDLRPGSGHPSPASISARHTSMMSTTPARPASPATGR